MAPQVREHLGARTIGGNPMIEVSVRQGDPFAYEGGRSRKGQNTDPWSREQRAIRLYEHRGHQIEQAGDDIFWVPSWDGERTHVVHYPVAEGETESCTCADHVYRGATCMHILAVAIREAKRASQRRRNFIGALMVKPGPEEGEE
jgi:hypothetical protein